ncbi:hypothetical protein [Nocardioides ungokensis]|uniref:hypothetical protein n=1 Tax=Nocardioides ungokensis TaxID=1643322 RepID=UPI001C60BFEA|nr:hypothetical protein [Nocardioides ungokensis]
MKGSAHYDGRAIDIFERPITPANKIRGWAIAQYLVAQADRLSIQTVIFDGRIWRSGSESTSGWRTTTRRRPPATRRCSSTVTTCTSTSSPSPPRARRR